MNRHSGKPSFDGLQILRGYAAAAVVFHHVLEESRGQLQTPYWFTRAGAAGVDIFFVLSGFIMLYTLPTGRNRLNEARSFFTRRLLRIGPLYWLIVVLIAVMHETRLFYRSLVVTPGTFARSLMFVERHNLVLGVGWTLNYEMYFYVIFACAICLTSSTKLITSLVATVIAADIVLIAPLSSTDWNSFLANPLALEFVAGMTLGLCYRRWQVPRTYARYLCLLGLCAICIGSKFGPALSTNGLTGYGRLLDWGGLQSR